ncbi:unnamed protein product [Porites evermanni]|uniref:Uncharacterized protein n=1 Tax=Porites evermanni TaxID=104178 RepID=A0ABN8SMH7_9CNID|nr:unnamed protein product [Porites evermanni]
MPESIANLRRENNDVKSKVSTLTEEISRLKDLFQQQSSSAAPSATEKSHSLEFLSKEYDDFLFFKTTANKELQRLSSQLSEVKARVDAIANAIDEFQEHSFQYNVKIVGVPEVCSDEAASTTSVKLFKEMGENISIQDIDTARRVPQRNNAGNPKPIVCRFVRRLVKESLMSHWKEISDVTPAAVGLPEGSSLSSASLRSSFTKNASSPIPG